MIEEKIDKYDKLLDNVSDVLEKARSNSYALLNEQIIKTYWQIGRYIIDFEQEGNIKAEYGKQLMDKLSKDLTTKYGKGFSRSNMFNIRLLYVRYPEIEKIPTQLTWSHYIELISITDDLERNFYEILLELGKGFAFVDRQYRIMCIKELLMHYAIIVVIFNKLILFPENNICTNLKR